MVDELERQLLETYPLELIYTSSSTHIEGFQMKYLNRITLDPAVMGGKPCVRGLRVTVGTLLGLLAAGKTTEQILALYPYLQAEDLTQALRYAAWRTEEAELSLTA